MKQNNTARKHRSRIVGDILDSISSEQHLQIQTKMVIAARLDDLITAKGWSKGDFAEKMDKNPSEITKWLSGGHNFTIDTLAEIAVVLDVPVADLVAMKQERSVQTVHFVISAQALQAPIPLITPLVGIRQSLSSRNIA